MCIKCEQSCHNSKGCNQNRHKYGIKTKLHDHNLISYLNDKILLDSAFVNEAKYSRMDESCSAESRRDEDSILVCCLKRSYHVLC